MSTKVKLGAYAVLLILAAWFAWGFYSNYSTATRESAVAATNEMEAATSNAVATTNVVAGATNESTNAPTNAAQATAPTVPVKHSSQGSMIGYLAALVGALIGLGLMIAYDITHYVGGAAVDAMLDDRGEGARDPEYERAEQTWANGKHLEAIQMMREFLKKNPREQYAALRIAEIYEKDLNNFLAAALEYEEVLKKKLPAERWGWAAIHLCNLYSKLGQQDKTLALLQRIADEYPNTAAAKKARARLGLPEPEIEHVSPAESMDLPDARPAPKPVIEEETEAEEPPPEAPKPNLPPGFRPKK